jgi:hypothetical protein
MLLNVCAKSSQLAFDLLQPFFGNALQMRVKISAFTYLLED